MRILPMTMSKPNNWEFEDLAVGYQTELIPCKISETDNQDFASISGNWNPLHTDPEFARLKGYKDCPLYGMLLASKFSYLLGMVLPGKDSVCLTQSLRFHKPVFIDETFYLRGTVLSKSESTRIVVIKTEILDAGGALAVDGEAQVLIKSR